MELTKTKPSIWNNFSDFFEDEFFKTRLGNGETLPKVNVVDNDGNYEVEFSSPGFDKEDIKVEVDNGRLTVSAESKEEVREEEKNYTRKEFSSKSFTRSFVLPEDADADNIDANYKDGILHLTINKSKDYTPPKKQIEVR